MNINRHARRNIKKFLRGHDLVAKFRWEEGKEVVAVEWRHPFFAEKRYNDFIGTFNSETILRLWSSGDRDTLLQYIDTTRALTSQ